MIFSLYNFDSLLGTFEERVELLVTYLRLMKTNSPEEVAHSFTNQLFVVSLVYIPSP